MDLSLFERQRKNRLIVSCQPVDDGPMDNDDMVTRLALAAIAGGASGLRIESATRVAKVKSAITAINAQCLLIGIVKRDLHDSEVRITPTLEDVEQLAAAGADVIAIDATNRKRPESVQRLIDATKSAGCLVMADCSDLADAKLAYQLGVDIIGTTLSGYTGGPVPDEPDYELLQTLTSKYPRVMAEGRFNTPAQCQRAVELGAWAVTVGTAITRTEVVTSWFGDVTNCQ